MPIPARMEEWISNLKIELNKLSSLDPKDRLGFVSAINKCMRILNSSSTGWLLWTNQPSLMKLYTKEELEVMFTAFRLLASRILGLNIEYGDKLLDKMQLNRKEDITEVTYVV